MEVLRDASTREEAEEAWEDHLHALDRIYNKLGVGARGYPESEKWIAERVQERGSDQLLNYMHQARNADTHRLDDLTEAIVARSKITSTGPIFVKHLTWNAQNEAVADYIPMAPGAELIELRLGASLGVLPVTNRGVDYPIAQEHLGTPWPERTAFAYAKAAVSYVSSTLVGPAAKLAAQSGAR